MTTSPDFPMALATAIQILALLIPGLFALALVRGVITLPSQDRLSVLFLFGMGFSLWLAAGWLLALTGLLEVRDATFPVFVLPAVATVILGLLLLSVPTWRRVVHGTPMELLLGVEAARILAFIFLPLVQSGVVPESIGSASWGDMLTGWLSIVAIIIWITRRKYRRGFVYLVTLVGLVDAAFALLNVLGSYTQFPAFGEFPFAAFVASGVSLLLLTHLYILFKLIWGSREVEEQQELPV